MRHQKLATAILARVEGRVESSSHIVLPMNCSLAQSHLAMTLTISAESGVASDQGHHIQNLLRAEQIFCGAMAGQLEMQALRTAHAGIPMTR